MVEMRLSRTDHDKCQKSFLKGQSIVNCAVNRIADTKASTARRLLLFEEQEVPDDLQRLADHSRAFGVLAPRVGPLCAIDGLCSFGNVGQHVLESLLAFCACIG